MWAKEKWLGGDIHVAREEFGEQTDLAVAVKLKAENGEFGEAWETLGAYADSRRVIWVVQAQTCSVGVWSVVLMARRAERSLSVVYLFHTPAT